MLGIRLMAMDDDLRNKATERIQEEFYQVVQTREFHALPSIKLELIGQSKKKIHVETFSNSFFSLRFEKFQFEFNV